MTFAALMASLMLNCGLEFVIVGLMEEREE